MRTIMEVAGDLGLGPDDLVLYGSDKAKVKLEVLERPRSTSKRPRLILVSAITPTPAGEGKTTTSIGLAQGLALTGRNAAVALREPSLGPCMGMKGGATGGGASCVHPSDSINLHFTGDFHAITSAHNLLSALVDNAMHHGTTDLDPQRVLWPRVMDMNDRCLRQIVVGLGARGNGVVRETGFDITAASEVMAILCLARDLDDLRARLGRITVGFTRERAPVTAADLGAVGPMMALLRDAAMPNLVQTTEGVPAFIHGGPFANIAHGCNSVLATRMAMQTTDWVITEAGFGFDLGAEKFFDIKCRSAGLDTSAVVIVATVRALKLHGGRKRNELEQPDPEAVERGLVNLAKHIEGVHWFGEQPIVALNRFAEDTDEEIAVVEAFCRGKGTPFAESRHFSDGGRGARDLAELVAEFAEQSRAPFEPLYTLEEGIAEKIEAVATKAYGARGVIFTKEARGDLKRLAATGHGGLPVCIAKTQYSLSDNPTLLGRPEGFDITVRAIRVNTGAGFVVVFTGDITRMPGLPKNPQALDIDVVDGEITGVG